MINCSVCGRPSKGGQTHSDYGADILRRRDAYNLGVTDLAESPAEFARLLARAYRGERTGEAMFRALADSAEVASQAKKLRMLQELENRMGDALHSLLLECGIDGGDDNRSRRAGAENAERLAGTSWESFLDQFAPVTAEALERYHRIRDLATDGENTVLRQLIAHEEALRAFAIAELEEDGRNSLAPVQQVIAWLSTD